MHEKYMRLALEQAKVAFENGDFPVGCVIADEKGVICAGYRKKSAEKNELDHAEIIALRKLYGDYSHRISGNMAIYSTMEPCLMCYSTLLLNRVHTVVYAYEDVMGGGTNLNLADLRPLFANKNVEIVSGILRQESLDLFKRFFSSDDSGYWKDSLLAQYTLEQR